MLYFYKKKLIFIVVLMLAGCSSQQSSKESTWTNDTYKLVVLTQCGAFAKIGTTDPKQMSSSDVTYMKEVIRNGLDAKALSKPIVKITLCCESYINKHYSQEFFMSQDNTTPILDEAFSNCD